MNKMSPKDMLGGFWDVDGAAKTTALHWEVNEAAGKLVALLNLGDLPIDARAKPAQAPELRR